MNPVLVLNASFEPLGIVSWQRAITLLILEKAELVERRGDEVLRTCGGQVFPLPSVVRLVQMARSRSRGRVPLTAKSLKARDGGRCMMNDCQRKGDSRDHVVPTSRGGKNVWENTVLCCTICNSKKGDYYLEEIGWTLKRRPFAPTYEVVLLSHVDRLPEWKSWIPAPRIVAA